MSEETDELRSKAEIIAEATGRTTEAVLEDLLDDGVVNLSNEETKDKDLVTQLKEAAELITTVQAVSQQVSENTVLNGGENKTDVKVETTLEGDVVDRAIASVERKAQNIRKIVVIIAPVILLLTGGVGLDFFLDDDNEDSSGEQLFEGIGGCLNPDALNYNPEADYEDGSCDFDDSGGGGGPPDCKPDWWWQNEAIFDHDHEGQGYNNDIRVQVDFRDLAQCNEHMNNGYFEIRVGDDVRIIEQNFHDSFTINEHYLNLDAGEYHVIISYETYDGSSWGGPEAWVTMESEPEPVRGCTDSSATNYNNQATEDDGSCEYPSKCDAFIDNLDTTVTDYGIDVTFFIGQTQDSECENFEVEVILLPVNNNPEQEISYETGLSETSNYFSYSFGFVPEGDWQVEAVVRDGNGDLDVQFSEELLVEYPEPECDYINIYSIYLENFTDSVRVTYDLDCPTDTQNEVVTALSVRATGTPDILNMEFNNHTVVDAYADNWILELKDFVTPDYTYYDFTWVMSYEDSNGQLWTQFQNWTDIEFEVSEPEPEPEPCENLTLISDGITLGKNATDNLTMDWKLNHDGPTNVSCFVELEVSITLYQNGTYYDISDFHKNGIHKIYANGTLFLDSSDVDMFADLPSGTYEVLVKYRIVGDTVSSQDYFANSVTIGSSSS
ncbi:MAG: hypothetical protein ACR2M9_04870 [Cyanophyceae cyanobacterium]